MKTNLRTILFLQLLLTLAFSAMAVAGTSDEVSSRILGKLTFTPNPNAAPKTDTAAFKTSADSARIISPAIGTVFRNQPVVFEIAPLCPVDSVLLMVRHSGAVETLSIRKSPPFTATWDTRNRPDQDQLHLQFGYVLFRTGGPVISAPALPHRWVLDRNGQFSRRSYVCNQTITPDSIAIDGDLSDWGRYRKAKIGDKATFGLLWTSSRLFFGATVYDTDLTSRDQIELHIDVHHSRTAFFDVNHRSIRFGPLSRSNTFVTRLSDTGSTLVDSINVRISREMEWRCKTGPGHYTIEAMIPFCVLSDLEFPHKRFGLDVTVYDESSGNTPEQRFHSWAGSQFYNRHNPGEWGSIVLRQALLPLRFALNAAGLLLLGGLVMILFMWLRQSYLTHAFEKLEGKSYSDTVQHFLNEIEKGAECADLSLDTIAAKTGIAPENLASLLQNETGTSFKQWLSFKRICRARTLLRTSELTIEQIAAKCGFSSINAFGSAFSKIAGTDPRHYREQAASEKLEEDE